MRSCLFLFIFLTPFLWAKPLAPLPPVLTPAVFSHQQALILQDSAPYYRLSVPLSVYQYSQRADLGDLRVFNAAGEVVPHALENEQVLQTEMLSQNTLRFFPLPPQTNSDIHLSVQISPDGNLIALHRQSEKSSAYILDASQIQGHFKSLILKWRETDYQSQVQLAGSDDLQHWQVHNSSELIQLNYQGQTLSQSQINLAGIRARYLRLISAAPLTLTDVKLQSSLQNSRPARRIWLTPVTAKAGGPGEYRFDLGIHAPADRLALTLPQINTVAQIQLQSRATQKDSWQSVSSALVYRLQSKTGEIHSPAIEMDRNDHRFWQLTVRQSGGGLGQGMPQLKTGWIPQQIAFVARGAPPFTLAFGNALVSNTAMNPVDLIVGNHIASATAGQLQNNNQGPPAASTPATGRTYGLWAALALAVSVLGGMAWKLLRETKTPTEGSGS
ncbi:MAG: DUF3999 domain-containing protein [Iodobacter sp.]